MGSNFDFRKAAQAAILLSPIMVGRTKMETPDIIGKDLTIIAFDFADKIDKNGAPVTDPVTGEIDNFGVVVFDEYPDNYYCVGTVFTKVCRTWAAAFDTLEEANSELSSCGGVRVRFTSTKTRKGNNLTAVEILN